MRVTRCRDGAKKCAGVALIIAACRRFGSVPCHRFRTS